MIILLIFASVFSAVISYIQKESYADSVIILIIVIINATLSFIEEKKADKAIEELNKMFITNNNVIRDSDKYCRNCGIRVLKPYQNILINITKVLLIIILIIMIVMFVLSYLI
jgi:cation transport ATPase